MMDTDTLSAIQIYVDTHYLLSVETEAVLYSCVACPDEFESDIDEYITQEQEESFAEVLFSFIETSGSTEVEIYRRAGLDRKHFSKIRAGLSGKPYTPKKETIISLGLSLELPRPSFDKLLASAGFSLSSAIRKDLVVSYCIEHSIFNVIDVRLAIDSIEHT